MTDARTIGLAITLIGFATMVTGIVVHLSAPDTGSAIAVAGAFITLGGRFARMAMRPR